MGDGGGGVKEYHLTVVLACVVAATAGLILGYHLAILSGVMSGTPELEMPFPEYNGRILGLFSSSAFLAALYCCPLASYVTRVRGRRPALTTGAVYFLVGSLLDAFAPKIQVLVLAHILLSIGVALLNQSAPLYLSEMAPRRHRRSLGMMFQLAITIGIIAANLINYKLVHWRWSLAAAVVPGLVVFVGALFLPDTPNSLIERRRPEEAKETLQKIRGTPSVSQEFNQLVAASEASDQITSPWVKLCQDPKYRPQLMFTIAVPLVQSATAITAIMCHAAFFYASVSANSELRVKISYLTEPLLPPIITSVVNAVATFFGVYETDRMFGRAHFVLSQRQVSKFLCVVGALIQLRFGFGGVATLSIVYAGVVVASICTGVVGYTSSLRPPGWLALSGLFSPEVRSAARSVNVAVHVICTHVIAQVFLWNLFRLNFGLLVAVIVLGMSVLHRLPISGY